MFIQYEDEIWGECELCGFDGYLEEVICRDGKKREVCSDCIDEMEGDLPYPMSVIYD